MNKRVKKKRAAYLRSSSLLFGDEAKAMVQNLSRNLLEERVVPTEAICRKP